MRTPEDDLDDLLERMSYKYPTNRHPLRDWWITIYNRVWWAVTSGPAYWWHPELSRELALIDEEGIDPDEYRHLMDRS